MKRTKLKKTPTKKKEWADLTLKERITQKRATRIGIAIGELMVTSYDSMALPTKKLRNKQENFIRNEYKKFNRMRKKAHIPEKVYKRLNSKGEVEIIK